MSSLLVSIILLFVGLFLILLGIGLLVFFYWGLWKLFTKAGQSGWKAIVPYYKDWVLMKDVCGLHWGWFVTGIGVSVLSLIFSLFKSVLLPFLNYSSVVTVVFSVLAWLCWIVSLFVQVALVYNLSKKFNKSTGWVVLTMFFGVITIPLLGFSKKEEYQNVKVSKISLYSALFSKK